MTEPTPQPLPGTDAPLLLYFLADIVAPAHGHLPGANTDVPGREAKANKADLASHLFAVAFWDLQQAGALTLAVAEKKVLFVKTMHVEATLTKQVPAAGIEAGMLAVLTHKQKASVHDLITAWYGKDMLDPWSQAIWTVQNDGYKQGFFSDAERGLVGALKGKPRVLPIQDAISARLPEAEALVARWQAYQTAEPALATQLLKECASGIKSRLEQSDSSDF